MLGYASRRTAQAKTVATKQPVRNPAARRPPLARIAQHAGVQPKWRMGGANDEFEREADRTAERVVAIPDSATQQPLVAGNIHAADLTRQQQTAAPRINANDNLSDNELQYEPGEEEFERPLAERIERLQAHGRPLPDDVREYMESRFGEDFSTVQIHTDTESGLIAQTIHAHAFTAGDHVVFGDGSFQPLTTQGRKLIAHELTHVVQQRGGRRADGAAAPQHAQPQENKVQRFYIPGVSEAAGFVGDLVDSAGNFIADQGWRLVRRYAPRLEPILRQGPFNWLKEHIGAAFDGVFQTLNRLNPMPVLENMVAVFGGMLERAGGIAQALLSGDCEPLLAALGQLKAFVVEVAGEAWNGLVTFLQPVGEFFSDLWDSVGAPAVQWLQNFAGDLWGSIQELGADIWEWTRPVRNAIGAAWDWVKEQLFGSEDAGGNSEGGIVNWIIGKAGEAWDWVKERTRPIWEPVQRALEWIGELLPPAFMRDMGEGMSELSQNLNEAEQQMGAEESGGDVAANRNALAAALPSLQQVLAGVRRLIIGTGQWLSDKVGNLSRSVLDFFSLLRNNSITRMLANTLSWLETGARALASWVREKVLGLFDWLARGFDALTPFIERVSGVAQRLIAVAGDLLQLPQLILSSVWNLIPECIRNPIKDFLVNQILARIPVFGQLLRIPDLWQRVQATAMRILRQVFVDGDIAGAAWHFFRSMLGLIGIPAQLVMQILVKAAGAVGAILRDPFGFIINTLRAVWQGFSQFFGKIGAHLLAGISSWLFGHMRSGGIQPPADLSLRSLLGVVMQILNITVERIMDRLGRRIGAPLVARLRRMLSSATGVWSFVRILIEEGPGGLWRELQERLSNLGSLLLDTVINWVTNTVITRISARLLTMLDPTGIMAVINAIMAVYRAVQSFVEHLREMLQILNSVLDGIGGIVTGAIVQAAGFLESALARAIPVAIAFLANQVPLHLGGRIREMVQGIRTRVDGAIDWLIDRAMRLGRGFINMLRRGAGAVRTGVARLREWWRARRGFTTDAGESHELFLRGNSRQATLMLASDHPRPYRAYVASLDIPSEKQAQRRRALEVADNLDLAIRDAARTSPTTDSSGQPLDQSVEINDLLGQLATLTATFLPGGADDSTAPVHGPSVHGFGSSTTVARLSPLHRAGSTPSSGNMGNSEWSKLARRKQGRGVFYIKGHLLNDNLGGPGNTWSNLTPLTQRANSDHKNNFESPVKEAVNGHRGAYTRPSTARAAQLKTVNFVVTANYGRQNRETEAAYLRTNGSPDDLVIADIVQAEMFVPRSLDCRATVQNSGGGSGRSYHYRVDNDSTIDNNLDHYSIRDTVPETVYINDMNQAQLMRLSGMTAAVADAIVAGRANGPYRSWAQVFSQTQGHTNIDQGPWEQLRRSMQRTSGYKVRIYRRN